MPYSPNQKRDKNGRFRKKTLLERTAEKFFAAGHKTPPPPVDDLDELKGFPLDGLKLAIIGTRAEFEGVQICETKLESMANPIYIIGEKESTSEFMRKVLLI